MLERIEKTIRSESIRYGIKRLMIGLILLGIAGYLYIGYVPLDRFIPTEEKLNQDVVVHLDSNLGSYSSEVASARIVGMFSQTIHTGNYYLIPAQDPDTGETYYMTIFVKPGQLKSMDKITITKEQMEAGTHADKKCTFYGTILPLRSGIVELQKEYMHKQGFTDEELEQKVLPYYINVTGTIPAEVVIFGALGFLFLGLALYRFSKGLSGSAYETFLEDMKDSRYEKEMIWKDLENAEICGDNESVRIGKYMTYLNTDGYAPRAIRNDKIQWAYSRIAFRDFFAGRGAETYLIKIYAKGERRPFKALVQYKMIANKVVATLNQKYPWIITEYSKELQRKYRKDPEKFNPDVK